MEKKVKEIIDNNVVEFSITLSLIEQLSDNYESLVEIAQKAEKKEISEYVTTYEVLRLRERTNNLLNLVHRLVSGMDATNEELLEITSIL